FNGLFARLADDLLGRPVARMHPAFDQPGTDTTPGVSGTLLCGLALPIGNQLLPDPPRDRRLRSDPGIDSRTQTFACYHAPGISGPFRQELFLAKGGDRDRSLVSPRPRNERPTDQLLGRPVL